MGLLGWLLGSTWQSKSPILTEAEQYLSTEEIEAIKAQLQQHGCTDYSSQVDEVAFVQQLCALPHLPQQLAAGLLSAVKRCSPASSQLTAEAVIVAKAKLERCGDETSQSICFNILDQQAAGSVARDHLHRLIQGCLQLKHYQNGLSGSPSEAVVSALVSGALQAAVPGSINGTTCAPAAASLTLDGYRRWCKSMPAVQQLLSSLLHNVGKPSSSQAPSSSPTKSSSKTAAPAPAAPAPAAPVSSLPTAKLPAFIVNGSSTSSLSGCLLEPSFAWALRQCLPPEQQQEWRLLFTSQKHGMSFNTLVAKLGEAAPTLLLVRDKAGHLFGGVASQPWQKRGTYYGDFGSFIFSLLPCAAVYHASGINQNFQWCGIGFSQLPNGLGFGGQVGHYAMFVDSTLEAGVSRPSATYASPCLASEQTFQVSDVECWLLQRPEEDALQAGGSRQGGQGSVLDKNKEDQHLLQLAGVNSNFSHGLRQPAEPIE